MSEKYLVQCPSGETFGIQWKRVSRVVTIGGLSRFDLAMRDMIGACLSMSIPRARMTCANKLKYVFSCTEMRWRNALDELRNNGYVLKQIETLGRIWR